MNSITILSGQDKKGKLERLESITLKTGELYTIVGNTGSGKSRFIKDIEQLAYGDSVTKRKILLDGKPVSRRERQEISTDLVAHLAQSMKFVLDTSVEEFINLHANCRGKDIATQEVLDMVNDITPEPVERKQNLNLLSGGQTRALMIADIALICDSPIVLIDEIENAGVDKEKALNILKSREKLVIVVTHDPHTALMAKKRIIMEYGAVIGILDRTEEEAKIYKELGKIYELQLNYQTTLRKGEHLL